MIEERERQIRVHKHVLSANGKMLRKWERAAIQRIITSLRADVRLLLDLRTMSKRVARRRWELRAAAARGKVAESLLKIGV